MLHIVWLWRSYYGCLWIPSKPGKFCFDTCRRLFGFLVGGFHAFVNVVLIAEGLLYILSDVVEVAIENIRDIMQLATDTAG